MPTQIGQPCGQGQDLNCLNVFADYQRFRFNGSRTTEILSLVWWHEDFSQVIVPKAARWIQPLCHVYLVPPRRWNRKEMYKDSNNIRWSQQQSRAGLKPTAPRFMSSAVQKTAWCLLGSRLIFVGLRDRHALVNTNPHTPGAPQNCCIPLTIPPPPTNLTFLFQGPHN